MTSSSTNTYSYFDKMTQGKVYAEFELDNGKPRFEKSTYYHHYRINLSLKTENTNVHRVIYTLDPSYYDPVRETTNAQANFKLNITTYGDYTFTVDVQVEGQIVRQRNLLSALLEEQYKEPREPATQEAIDYIKQH